MLAARRAGGTEQRNIEQQGILADLAQFEQERDYPMQRLQFMQSLLGGGLPLETQTYSYSEPSGLQSLLGTGTDLTGLYDMLERYFKPKQDTSDLTPEQKAALNIPK